MCFWGSDQTQVCLVCRSGVGLGPRFIKSVVVPTDEVRSDKAYADLGPVSFRNHSREISDPSEVVKGQGDTSGDESIRSIPLSFPPRGKYFRRRQGRLVLTCRQTPDRGLIVRKTKVEEDPVPTPTPPHFQIVLQMEPPTKRCRGGSRVKYHTPQNTWLNCTLSSALPTTRLTSTSQYLSFLLIRS